MRREVAANINELLDREDPDYTEQGHSARISQIILTGADKTREIDEEEDIVAERRAQMTDVVAFKK